MKFTWDTPLPSEETWDEKKSEQLLENIPPYALLTDPKRWGNYEKVFQIIEKIPPNER